MFAAPPVINAEVFAELPASFRNRQLTAEQRAAGRSIPVAGCFLEGPSFDRHGNLYCTDIPFGRIFRVSAQGAFELVAEYDGEPNGLKIHQDGRIFIADFKNGLMQLDPVRGTVTPVVSRYAGEHFRGLNDLCFASNGDLYFTDQGQTGLQDPTGRVYCLRASGRLDLLIDRVPSPNGLVLNGKENTLFVAATRGNAVWRLPLTPDGKVSRTGNWTEGQIFDHLAASIEFSLDGFPPFLVSASLSFGVRFGSLISGTGTLTGTPPGSRVGYCPGGYCPGGYCPGGYCPGGYCPGGYCPGGYCPGYCAQADAAAMHIAI